MAESSEALEPRVLVVDRDLAETRALVEFLRGPGGLSTVWARDGEAAHNILEDPDEPVHAMVAELKAQRIDGLRLLREGLRRRPELCVVLMSRDAPLETVTAAVRAGATDFQAKPVNPAKLLAVLRQGIARQELRIRLHVLQEQLSDRYGFERVAGRSKPIEELLGQLRQASGTLAPVLLQGEAGTGKGLLAQTIHYNSPRRDHPLVSVPCAGLSESVLEAELFGGPKGARLRGRMEIAAHGTLFLDHISELPPRLQTRLFATISEWRVSPAVAGASGAGAAGVVASGVAGASGAGAADVAASGAAGAAGAAPRLISATEQDLADLVRRGKFRDDLFYALSAASVRVPALRERREDIPLLTQALLEELNREHGRQVSGVTRGCMDLLMRYSWPGNVRELKAVLEGIVVFSDARRPLEAGDLPEYLRDRPPVPQDFRVRVGMSLAEIERRAIQETLGACGGSKPRAAKMLGIGLRTLYRKIREYELG